MGSLSNGDFRAILVSPTAFQNCPCSPQMLASGERNLSAGIYVYFSTYRKVHSILLLVMLRAWILYSFTCPFLLIFTDFDFGGYMKRLRFTLPIVILTCPEVDSNPIIQNVKM